MLDKSFIFKSLKKDLIKEYGCEEAERVWKKAGENLSSFRKEHPDMDSDSRNFIMPIAALYSAKPESLPLLKNYGTEVGRKIAGAVYGITSVPGVSKLLWKNMPELMHKMSSPEKGYKRRIVCETKELVGVDILECPLHQAAVKLGVPQTASVICAMDKAYMTGFKYIEYTRTKAIGEGDAFCDYRLKFDKNKK